jgi:hypothetical protein
MQSGANPAAVQRIMRHNGPRITTEYHSSGYPSDAGVVNNGSAGRLPVLYRLQELGVADLRIWPQFQAAYSRQASTILGGHDEPLPLTKADFAPESSRAQEPVHLADVDFMQDRLFRLVREAVESDAITLSRAAEILEVTLSEMRELSASWID